MSVKMLKIHQRFRFNGAVSLVKYLSTQPAPQEPPEHEDKQLKEFQRISNIQRKIRTRKPQKPPFVKNLFLGVYDVDVLTYPEISNEEVKNLNRTVEEVKGVLREPDVGECDRLSREFLRKLGQGRVLGLQGSQLMNGRELTATESCRVFEEISQLPLKNTIISSETLGVQALVKFGSDHLQRKYLQRLIDGESLSSFCVVEELPEKKDILKVTASRSIDGKSWVLNGQKNLVVNGSDADVYVVVANTDYIIKDEHREKKYGVFVVERDFGGITSTRRSTEGGYELSDLVFENTHIPNENLIGSEVDGEKILSSVYPEYRLSIGPRCSVLLKNLINKMTEHYINTSESPNFLYETDAVRIKMGQLASSLYAIDSMVYLTSGLIDNYENQDTELESTIVKIFGSEQAFLATSTCLDLVGGEATQANHWCYHLHKEAICQMTLNDNNDNLKMLIALFGLRHAGQQINELVRKVRNPLFHASTILKRLWTHRNQAEDNFKLNLFLHHYLHPSCMQPAQNLEYCVLRLQYATEIFLSRYGAEVVNKHADLRLLAECIVDIYAMTAVLGRASRSYCIGLQHGEYEMTLATAFVTDATKRVKGRLTSIIDGPYLSTDENFRFVSKRLFDFKEYYPVHALCRNF